MHSEDVIQIQKTKYLYMLMLFHITWCNMVKILIDLSKEEDRIVEMFKLVNNLNTKQEAVKKMVQYFEAEVKPKNLKNKDYFEV